MSTLDTALALASEGLPVFPCRENKAPACDNGFKDAATDPAAIRAMFARSSAVLIGVPTGPASGVDVLDIDPRHDGDTWWSQHAHLIPPTRMHETRSGGLHVLFRQNDAVRNTESKLAAGVDTRGTGGYIIWWPGEGHPIIDDPVNDWPDWLLNRLLRRLEQESRPRRAYRPLDSTDHAQRIADRVMARIARAGAGQRYYTLRKGAYTLGGLLHLLPFDDAEAIDRLVDAANDAGAEDERQAGRIAKWGLDHGKAKQFQLREDR